MSQTYDVIIVGSGPAGVSAAFPLVERGLRVLMLDGGHTASELYPSADYLSARATDIEQWRWMIGADFYALRQQNAVSPKLRVPAYKEVFADYSQANRITAENFVVAGSLATGGLSNAWGCGVARLSAAELAEYPCSPQDMDGAYAAVAQRIGISGSGDDDLSDYFGLDSWAQPPISADALNQKLLLNYERRRAALRKLGVRVGRSRIAVLSQDYGARRACDVSGNCLWGCARQSLYSSAYDVAALKRYTNFTLHNGFIVDAVRAHDRGWVVRGKSEGEAHLAHRVVVAAGTLATTRIVFDALNYRKPTKLLSCPTAAFLLWLPSYFGTARTTSFGLGQLSFAVETSSGATGFGSTFSTNGIPISEFVRHVPLVRSGAIDVLRALLSSCLVGNLFLSGRFSRNEVQLAQDGDLEIRGGYYNEDLTRTINEAASRLRRAFLRLGALVLPGSFQQGAPGADIHYAGTLPMRSEPQPGETNGTGEVLGLPGVYVVDGACLPALSEKSHTLTIMANAHRIACHLAAATRHSDKAVR